MKSYVLCTVPRSGSWLLADLLEQTDLAGRPEEYFRPDYRKQWSAEWDIPEEGPYGRYVRAALANTVTDNGVFGVKMHWYQFAWFIDELRAIPGAVADTADKDLVERWLPRPHYVHLHRDDTVRQAVSYYRAGYSDRWFHLADEDSGLSEARFIRPLPMPEEPDWGHIRALENLVIAHEQCWSDFFTRSGIVPLEIRYEDMALSCDQTLRRVLDFIDVPLAPHTPLPSPRLKKQAYESTERMVKEYLVHRDTVTPRTLNLASMRAGVAPLAFYGAAADPVSSPPGS